MTVLSRLSTRSALFHSIVKSSFPKATIASSFHAGTTSKSEEKSAAAPAPVVAEEPSFLEKTGLSDWKISLPILGAIAIPAVSNGIYTFNEESQLACCFLLFVTSAYKLSSDMVAQYFDARADAILREHNEIEDNTIALVKEALEQFKANQGAAEDLVALHKAYEDFARLYTQAHAAKLRHDVRATFVKNLEYIIKKEEEFNAEVQQRMVDFATKKVTEEVIKGGKALQESAFQSSLDALLGKDSSSKDDEVKALFSKYVKQYAEEVSARDGKVIKLSPEEVEQLQHELDIHVRNFDMHGAVIKAPTEVTLEIPK